MKPDAMQTREPAWLTALAPSQRALLARLGQWVQAGWLRELDQAFAAFLAREAADADPALLLAAALASHQLGRGHVCLDLAATLQDAAGTLALPPERWERPSQAVSSTFAGTAPEHPSELLAGLDLPHWTRCLQHPRLVSAGEGSSPLVLDGDRLYLRRYWTHERTVRTGIEARLARGPGPGATRPEALREPLATLFPPGSSGPGDIDWQKAACAIAAQGLISVITGGPGTGKTTTVVKLLAVLQHLALHGQIEGRPAGRPLRIRLAAPTGKAAARLNESIAGAVERLPLHALPASEALRRAIPTEVTTVHRLLGSAPDSRHFRHHRAHPLLLDVLVLDEASMIDLEMMAAVLEALPTQARLILLGDKDQLASVEAGAVLGELCRRADQGHYTPATRDALREITGDELPAALVDAQGLPLDQVVVKLRHSWRFSESSGIGQLAAAVNAGDQAGLARITAARPPDLAWISVGAGGDDAALRRLVVDGAPDAFPGGAGTQAPVGYGHYLKLLHEGMSGWHDDLPSAQAVDAWAHNVLTAYGEFQLLCALRQGPHGVDGLNRAIARILLREGLIDADQGWYLGRPVMVTRNDYAVGLMNGDVGVTLATPVATPADDAAGRMHWKLRVAFPGGDAGRPVHWVLPSRLQAVETVYAMTVHKSQGSEFSHAALVLPATDSRVLTRELVYTGITRARRWFTLAQGGDPAVLEQAVRRRLQRAGGPLS